MSAHQLSKERQRARNQVIAAESRVHTMEERIRQIEMVLSHPSAGVNVVALSQEHGGVQTALSEALIAWEQAGAYAEALEQSSG